MICLSYWLVGLILLAAFAFGVIFACAFSLTPLKPWTR
jgi:hypothetical protein